MWTRIARRKNSYLHKTCDNIDPCCLNRSMSHAMSKPIIDTLDMNPPLNVPTSHQPICFAPQVDETKAFIAYGRRGIPKLIKDIHNEIPYIRSCSLASLTDELCDSKKCFTAINLNIVKRLETYLQQLLKDESQDLYQINKICINLEIIATHLDGALKILNENRLIDNLYYLINITQHAIIVLYKLASHPKVAQDMIDKGHLIKVKTTLEKVNSEKLVYELLAYLLERSPAKGFSEGYFEILHPLLKINNNLQSIIMKCFAIIIQCTEGQLQCDKTDTVKTLYTILIDNEVDQLVHVYTSMALQNCTLSKKSKWRCREIWDLPLILVKHAYNKCYDNIQIHCLQVLRQITEMPSIKNFVRKCCKRNIKNICCNSDRVIKYKIELLKWLRFKNYHSTKTMNIY